MNEDTEEVVDRSLFGTERHYGLRDVWIDEESPLETDAPWWKRGVPIIMMLCTTTVVAIVACVFGIVQHLH